MTKMVQGVVLKVGGPKEGVAAVCTSFQGSSGMSGVESMKWRLFASLVIEANLENIVVGYRRGEHLISLAFLLLSRNPVFESRLSALSLFVFVRCMLLLLGGKR